MDSPSSIIVDHLEQSFKGEDIAITYIYCSYKEQEDQTTVNLIANLLRQLVQKTPVIANEIVSLYNDHIKRNTAPTLAEWSKMLQSEARRVSKVFIIIDALDECSQGTRNTFLAEIQKLHPTIHLMVTSRHIGSIEPEFEKAVCVEICANEGDVRRYLEDRIEREPRLVRNVKGVPALQETVINAIVKSAKGM